MSASATVCSFPLQPSPLALCLPVGAVLGLPFIFAIGVAAAFMALIVRVIKNAFAQAVKMKDELDYTV